MNITEIKNLVHFNLVQAWHIATLKILITFYEPEDRHPAHQAASTKEINVEEIDYYPHQLFPHHWGVIKKLYQPEPDQRPGWMTIQAKGKDIKLQATELDRLYHSREEAVGVRFDSLTNYLLFDIDIRSLCHPNVNRSEWDRLLKCLKEIGLLNPIAMLSSKSGGIHLYFWFNNGEQLKTFQLAQLLWAVCHANGFNIKQGNLEIFPNAKKFDSMYNGHRLPLQASSGSVLVDGEDLVERWDLVNPWQEFCSRVANSQQDMDLLRKKLAWGVNYQQKHSTYRGGENMSTNAAVWQQNLLERLLLGWTGKGQTNELIRTACVREWVFNSDGDRNDAAVINQLINMPGFREHCGHQDEIADRVEDWMTCVINYYWPYSRQDMRHGRPILEPDAILDFNQPPELTATKIKSTKRQDDVLSRLHQTVTALMDQPLPKKISEIIKMMQEKAKELGIETFSRGTLYSRQYLQIWRILVEIAQSQAEQGLSRNLSESKKSKKTASKPESEKAVTKLSSMKVSGLVRIAAINFLVTISSSLEFIFDRLVNTSENLVLEAGSSIETNNFISFTNINTSSGAPPADISKADESSEYQRLLDCQHFADQDDSIRVGDRVRSLYDNRLGTVMEIKSYCESLKLYVLLDTGFEENMTIELWEKA